MQSLGHNRSGQAMLLTVLTLGGTILGATTIAGLLMVYQLRQTTDLTNSGKALFAADAGIEFGLYRFFKDPNYPKPLVLSNGASFVEVTTGSSSIKSIGSAANSRRAFFLLLQNATTTYP